MSLILGLDNPGVNRFSEEDSVQVRLQQQHGDPHFPPSQRLQLDTRSLAKMEQQQATNPESDRFQEGSTMLKYTDRHHQNQGEGSSIMLKQLGTERLYSDRPDNSAMMNSIISEENTRMQTMFGGGGASKGGTVGDLLQKYQQSTFQLLDRYNKGQYSVLPKNEQLNELAVVDFCPVTGQVLEKEIVQISQATAAQL